MKMSFTSYTIKLFLATFIWSRVHKETVPAELPRRADFFTYFLDKFNEPFTRPTRLGEARQLGERVVSPWQVV